MLIYQIIIIKTKNMIKKLLFIGMVALSSCSKETCNCGKITNDDITYDANGNTCYSLTIRNTCSGNLKTWCFDHDVWFDANVGEDFCVTNENSW